MMHHIELELCEDSSGLQGLVLIVLGANCAWQEGVHGGQGQSAGAEFHPVPEVQGPRAFSQLQAVRSAHWSQEKPVGPLHLCPRTLSLGKVPC